MEDNNTERYVFLYGVVFLFSLYLTAIPWMQSALINSADSALVSVPFFMTWLGASLLFLKFSQLPVPTWGIHSLTPAQWRLGGTTTLALLGSAYAAMHLHLIAPDTQTSLKMADTDWWPLVLYTLFVPVQEYISRGILLGGLLYYFGKQWPHWVCCGMCGIIYAGLHLYLGWEVALIVLLPGLAWSFLYYKTRSVFLVSLSHLICGLYWIYLLSI